MNCKKNRKEHLFRNAIHGIIESVDKVKDQKRTVFMEKIDHNAHSVYLMYYHLIMVVKYRRKVIDDTISERAKEIWNVLHLIMESHWKNGIMMLIMCMLCFGHSQNQNSVNLSMRIKVQAVVC